MNTVTLSPLHKPIFQIQPQQSHPRLSLTRVLWVRFIRWIDKASPQAVWKALRRASTLLLVSLAVFVPQHLLGILLSAAKWNGAKVPLFCALLWLTLNARRLLSKLRSRRLRKSSGAESSYRGLPASELASFLKETEAFKRDEAMQRFRISEDKWRAIAEELEAKGLLTRGEKNARILRPISYVNLVRQLADKYPLVWDEAHECFVERDGAYARYCLDQEFKRKKLAEVTHRKERKLDRLQGKIEEARQHPLFAQLA